MVQMIFYNVNSKQYLSPLQIAGLSAVRTIGLYYLMEVPFRSCRYIHITPFMTSRNTINSFSVKTGVVQFLIHLPSRGEGKSFKQLFCDEKNHLQVPEVGRYSKPLLWCPQIIIYFRAPSTKTRHHTRQWHKSKLSTLRNFYKDKRAYFYKLSGISIMSEQQSGLVSAYCSCFGGWGLPNSDRGWQWSEKAVYMYHTAKSLKLPRGLKLTHFTVFSGIMIKYTITRDNPRISSGLHHWILISTTSVLSTNHGIVNLGPTQGLPGVWAILDKKRCH